jgi:hypothetical protein
MSYVATGLCRLRQRITEYFVWRQLQSGTHSSNSLKTDLNYIVLQVFTSLPQILMHMTLLGWKDEGILHVIMIKKLASAMVNEELDMDSGGEIDL